MIWRAVSSLFLMLLIVSCTDRQSTEESSAVTEASEEKTFSNDLSSIKAQSGLAGFYAVPEMLCLSIADSGRAEEMAAKVRKNYNLLEQDLAYCGADKNGAYGQITYNNDTSNFKFECVVLIRSFPKRAPRQAKVVVVEKGRMLMYNHYGPYQLLYKSYDDLRRYLRDKHLTQVGPMRELYLTDPRVVADEWKWRTLLMVPVADVPMR